MFKIENITVNDSINETIIDLNQYIGSTGSQGPQGQQGVQGNIGIQGPQGNIGQQGVQGNIGQQGVQGNIGQQGVQGNIGIQGPQGVQGFQGNIGIQGPQGNIGQQGPQGNIGDSGITTGTWNINSGSNTVSFTTELNSTYVMWVRGNIPNGICIWNATVSISNPNVPVIGTQNAWYYTLGNMLVLTSIPSQIISSSGNISTISVITSTANTFTFGITNNSGSSQTVYYGYFKVNSV